MITSPTYDEFLKETIDITGTVEIPNFQFPISNWELTLKNIAASVETVLVSDTTTIKDGVLFNWDTKQFADGDYELSLTARNSTDTTSHSVQITIDNTLPTVEITSPNNDNWICSRIFGVVDILGTITDDNLSSYKASYSIASESTWVDLHTFNPKQRLNQKIGEWDVRKLGVGSYELRVEARDLAGNSTVVEKEIVLQPELSISSGDITITNIDGMVVPSDKLSSGMYLIINANVANNSIADADDVSVELFNGDPINNNLLSSVRIRAPAQENAKASILWNTEGYLDNYDLYVVVNRSKEIPESDYSNNQAIRSITLNPSDTTTPQAPTDLTGIVNSEKTVDLSWSANPDGDLAGYNIYRQFKDHPPQKLNMKKIELVIDRLEKDLDSLNQELKDLSLKYFY